MVAYGYVMDALNANMQTAQMTLTKDGGAHVNESHKSTWQATNAETNDTSTVTVPTLAIGNWLSSQDAPQGPLRDISGATGRATVLFERINPEGDMMRVGGAAAEIGRHTELGTYVPARLPGDEPNPIVQSVLSGQVYRGRLYLQGSWHTVVCNPLRQGMGETFGMFCVGLNNSGIRSLQEEFKANYVGANGSVALFYVHGRDRGKLLAEPTGLAKATQAQWSLQILEKSLTIKDRDVDEIVQVHDAATGADVVMRFTYFEKSDWAIAIIAGSPDLALASNSVTQEFRKLLWRTFFLCLIAIVIAPVISLRLSKRVIGPMADLTIRLTSNATSIASSARQQAANVANINT